MHPIALFHKIFSEEHTLESSLAMILKYARQRKRDVLQYLPIISKFPPPMFKHGLLPLIIHSGTPPPSITIAYVTIMPSQRSHKRKFPTTPLLMQDTQTR